VAKAKKMAVERRIFNETAKATKAKEWLLSALFFMSSKF